MMVDCPSVDIFHCASNFSFSIGSVYFSFSSFCRAKTFFNGLLFGFILAWTLILLREDVPKGEKFDFSSTTESSLVSVAGDEQM